MSELLAGLPPLLAGHVALAFCALAAAAAISLPLALVLVGRPRIAGGVLALAGVVQTIPGLALLALMVPLLAATHGLGVGASTFGFAPAFLALTLYAILPMLRNAITGLRGVDASVVEAARGMGMAPRQVLLQVQLPLAAPVIAAGVRTAAVWTVGAATLATPVGQRCLGNYIFAGLQTRDWSMLLVGVAAAAALAVALDVALAVAEHALAQHRRAGLWAGAGGVLAIALACLVVFPALAGGDVAARDHAEASSAHVAGVAAPITHVKLGAKTFTEQYVLAAVLAARLEQVGISVELIDSLGSTVTFDALAHGDIDLYVDYSGTLWLNQLKRAPGVPRWQLLAELAGWLAAEHGIRSLGTLGFENAYALAIRRDTSTRLGLTGLDQLGAVAGKMSLGADYELLSRREWASARDAYGLKFSKTASFDPSFLYEALKRGEVDVISAFSSDGRIAADDLVVLADPAGAFPPYDAMILLGPRIALDAHVQCALRDLQGKLTVDLMRQANDMVDRSDNKATPKAAAAWLLGAAKIPPASCAP